MDPFFGSYQGAGYIRHLTGDELLAFGSKTRRVEPKLGVARLFTTQSPGRIHNMDHLKWLL